MRGARAKQLRRVAQETAEPSRQRWGFIEPPQAWRRKAYMMVCLGVRRMYLDLKRTYKKGGTI